MGTIKQTRTVTRYRKSKSKPKHCPTCGAFVAGRGNRSAKTRVHKWWTRLYKVKDTLYWNPRKNNKISFKWIFHNKDVNVRKL